MSRSVAVSCRLLQTTRPSRTAEIADFRTKIRPYGSNQPENADRNALSLPNCTEFTMSRGSQALRFEPARPERRDISTGFSTSVVALGRLFNSRR
jgi:hypothetical protein